MPLSGSSLPPPFPPCSLRTALARYADVLSSPKKVLVSSLKAMHQYNFLLMKFEFADFL